MEILSKNFNIIMRINMKNIIYVLLFLATVQTSYSQGYKHHKLTFLGYNEIDAFNSCNLSLSPRSGVDFIIRLETPLVQGNIYKIFFDNAFGYYYINYASFDGDSDPDEIIGNPDIELYRGCGASYFHHRLIELSDVQVEAELYCDFEPSSSRQGKKFNINLFEPLVQNKIYKINRNGISKYYYVNYTSSANTSDPDEILTDNFTIEETHFCEEEELITIDEAQNYVLSIKPYIRTTSINGQNNDSIDSFKSITYYDGLGRSKQQIDIKASPNRLDLVTPIAYNSYGRKEKEYLTYQSSNMALGSFKDDAQIKAQQFYYNKYPEDFSGLSVGGINPYNENVYESSFSDRILKIGAPGKSWKINQTSNNDHAIKYAYSTNNTNDVIRFDVSINNSIPSLIFNNYYDKETLYKTVIKSENWTELDRDNHTSQEFRNFQDQVILKRTFSDNESHDTYYVYDDYGNLTYVLPPNVDTSQEVTQNVLNNLCYQYRYDYRDRLIEKKIPGKDWEYIIYNEANQPILTQDGNLRARKQWLFNKYDIFDRIAYTGIWTNPEVKFVHNNSTDNYDEIIVPDSRESVIEAANNCECDISYEFRTDISDE